MIKSYKDLCRLRTFEERYEYLKIGGIVGRETFAFERYINQSLYHSGEWKKTRHAILIRDDGCDLAIPDREIFIRPMVHHINPITVKNIERGDDCVFDPDNLISTSHNTHNAIHYGDASLLVTLPQERRKGDTAVWTISSPLSKNF